MNMKNKPRTIHDLDKNVGAAMADKEDVIIECKRQLYDINTCIKLPLEEIEILRFHIFTLFGKFSKILL